MTLLLTKLEDIEMIFSQMGQIGADVKAHWMDIHGLTYPHPSSPTFIPWSVSLHFTILVPPTVVKKLQARETDHSRVMAT